MLDETYEKIRKMIFAHLSSKVNLDANLLKSVSKEIHLRGGNVYASCLHVTLVKVPHPPKKAALSRVSAKTSRPVSSLPCALHTLRQATIANA